MWDEIIYPFRNFAFYRACEYLSMLRLKVRHGSKGVLKRYIERYLRHGDDTKPPLKCWNILNKFVDPNLNSDVRLYHNDEIIAHTICARFFILPCIVVVNKSVYWFDLFNHIHQDYFAGKGAWFVSQSQWHNPDGYG